MVSKQKINREKVQAALNTLCPKCGYSIPPERVRRIDFDSMECPNCGERFSPGSGQKRALRNVVQCSILFLLPYAYGIVDGKG